MRYLIIALLILVWFSPSSVVAKSSQVVIPCGTEQRVFDLTYSPPTESQTYRVSFRAQGVGTVRLHQTPIYVAIDTTVNTPSVPQDFTYDVTIPRYPGRPHWLILDGNAAPCATYPNGLTVTNFSIVPIALRMKAIVH